MSARQLLRAPAGRSLCLGAVLLVWGALVGGCQEQASALPLAVGDPQSGSRLVDTQVCGSCHIIPGHAMGVGLVGPPLTGFARRTVIAGMLPNTPDNLVLWLQHPQSVVRGNGMPDMGLTQRQARDIAAYLYTLE